MITIYTDGAVRGNPGPGGWGTIIANNERVVEIGGDEAHTTNNRMELVGAIKALEFAGTISDEEIELYTDSEYVMKGMTEWVEGWKRRGWHTASKKPVLNQDLWHKLVLVADGKEIEWKYVAGHSGHKANERCDEIATAFADSIDIKLYNGPRSKYPVEL